MSQYKIFKHPNEDIHSVKQGFCWPAYFFQWAWAIVSGIFVLLIFWFFSNATLSKIFSQYPNLSSADYALWGAFIIFWAIITTIPGFKANAWREKNLLSRGYELKEIITDKSKWGVITLSLKTIKSYLKGSAGKTAKIANFTGDKNLENNAYKIFLTKKYLIEKNEALGQFISQDELFNTIEEALEYANNLESEAAKIKEIKSNEALLKVKERVGHIKMLLALKSFVSILFGHIKNGVNIAITKIDSKNSLTVENKSRVVTFVSYAIVLVAIGIVHDVFDDSPLYVSQETPSYHSSNQSTNQQVSGQLEKQRGEKAKAELEAREEAERQAQASTAIKVFKKREWVSGWNKAVTYLNIQSVSDIVTVQRVVLNRGRCQINSVSTNRGAGQLPIQLRFGDVVKVNLDAPQCDLLEVEVTTNLGTTSYSL